MTVMRVRISALALALLFAPAVTHVGHAATIQAAEPTGGADPDPRWQGFLGCWAPLTSVYAEDSARVLCFDEQEDRVVTMSTLIDGELRGDELIVADGTARAVREEACMGTETASWSGDGARVYLRSSLRCGDAPGLRETARVLALGGAATFVEIRADDAEDRYGADGRYGVRASAYRALEAAEYPAPVRHLADHADDPTRLYAVAPLSLEDIVEAAGLLPPAAVQAMVVHLPTGRLRVDADALLALEEAGVDAEVIDLVVAVAHPEKFALAVEPLPGAEDEMRDDSLDPYGDSWWGSGRFGYGGFYSPFGFRRYGGFYSPFGYDPYLGGFGRGGTIIIIDRDDIGTSRSRGLAVKGRGYTRPGGTSFDGSSSVSRSGRTDDGGSVSGGSGGGSGSTRKARPKS